MSRLDNSLLAGTSSVHAPFLPVGCKAKRRTSPKAAEANARIRGVVGAATVPAAQSKTA